MFFTYDGIYYVLNIMLSSFDALTRTRARIYARTRRHKQSGFQLMPSIRALLHDK